LLHTNKFQPDDWGNSFTNKELTKLCVADFEDWYNQQHCDRGIKFDAFNKGHKAKTLKICKHRA